MGQAVSVPGQRRVESRASQGVSWIFCLTYSMLRLAARSDEACEAEGAAAAASVASGAQAAEAEGEALARRLRPCR